MGEILCSIKTLQLDLSVKEMVVVKLETKEPPMGEGPDMVSVSKLQVMIRFWMTQRWALL